MVKLLKIKLLKFLPTSAPIIGLVIVSALLLFACSSLKHLLFQSTAWDLGIFDQAVYLISQGQPPISSFTNFHILGDHAAFILYPISLLYKLYPSVYWLLTVQAFALALAALPAYHLAKHSGLAEQRSLILAGAYLLYPLVFNLNLFDFHPEVIALPALFWAILAARTHRIYQFCTALIIILSCKAVIALTVAATGVWLILCEQRRWYGAIAIFAGISWFIVATQLIIPTIGGEGASVARHINRYSYLGSSFSEIAINLIAKPQLVLSQIFSVGTLEYFALLFSPVIWFLSPRYLSNLIPAIPALALNVLSGDSAQRDVIHQYSLPILPFLILVMIASLKDKKGWLHSDRTVILWALLGFLILSRLHFFAGRYWEALDTWQPTRAAIAQVINSEPKQGKLLTTAEIAPHLTQRPTVKLAITEPAPNDLTQFDFILLNTRHPGWLSNPEFAKDLVERSQHLSQLELIYRNQDVYLFRKRTSL